MPKTPNRNPLPRPCKIKAVDPAFRSVSTPRWPNELGETSSVYRERAPERTGDCSGEPEWSTEGRMIRLRSEPLSWASRRLVDRIPRRADRVKRHPHLSLLEGA